MSEQTDLDGYDVVKTLGKDGNYTFGLRVEKPAALPERTLPELVTENERLRLTAERLQKGFAKIKALTDLWTREPRQQLEDIWDIVQEAIDASDAEEGMKT